MARISREYGERLSGRIAQLQSRISSLRTQGLMESEGELVRLAPGKLSISNEVLVELLS